MLIVCDYEAKRKKYKTIQKSSVSSKADHECIFLNLHFGLFLGATVCTIKVPKDCDVGLVSSLWHCQKEMEPTRRK